VKPADGSSNEELLMKGSNVALANDWSLDGKFILYTERNARAKGDLWVLSLEGGTATPRPYLQDDFDKAGPKFSPDGKWVAYASEESGQWQVYVQSFPVLGGKHQVSTSGGTMPRWRRDGKELFYIGADGKMMAAEVKAGSAFESSLPKPLFAAHTRRVLSRTSYAVSGDGQRFLISDLLEASPSSPLTVVLNWTADLKR
jgi:dipeptidyl aminopeptidase/acylaminoacyl peptidase